MTILAVFAGLTAGLSALAMRGQEKTVQAKPGFSSVRAAVTQQPPDGPGQTPMSPEALACRAMRMGNRKPEAVAAFVARHQALRRG